MALRIVPIASIVLSATFGFFGSMCHGQSSGGDVTKDPGATDTSSASGDTVTLDGVDTSALTPREKKEWGTYVSQFIAPCSDTPVSIAECVKQKRACDKCVPAAKYILRSVRDGEAREQVENSYKNRFDASKIKSVTVDDSPTKGPDNAPVTLIEFADFECPHCGLMAPRLDKFAESHPNDVRFVYKFMPLKGHLHAEPAARAAIAAMKQGKFWQMHHALYENQQHLEQADIDSYARDLGLDIPRFHADMQAPETTDKLERDRKLADSLQVQGTPTIYINGREYDPQQELADWFTLEMQMLGQKPGNSGSTQPPPQTPSGMPTYTGKQK